MCVPVISFTSFLLEFPFKSCCSSNSGCLLLWDVSFLPCICLSPSFPFLIVPMLSPHCLKKGSVHTGGCGAFSLCSLHHHAKCLLLSEFCSASTALKTSNVHFPTNITSLWSMGQHCPMGTSPDQWEALTSIHDSPSLCPQR